MKKEQVISLIRHILSALGGTLLAKGVASESVILDVIGTILSLVAVGWSISDKTFKLNQLEGVVRQVLTTVGLFVAFFSPSNVELVIGFLTSISATILGQTSKLKSVPVGTENK